MHEEFARSQAVFGGEAMQKLYNAKVALFGVGGVGGWCAEALARSGVGAIDLYDGDTVSLSNINRQLVALRSTVGRSKTAVAAERIGDINPGCRVRAFDVFIDENTFPGVDIKAYDCVLDAVDTVSAKVLIISHCIEEKVPVISCMGAGNKLDITAFRVADISKTTVCPLARAVRSALKKRGIYRGVKAVFSTEQPSGSIVEEDGSSRHIPASNVFAPAAAGLMLAREAVLSVISGGAADD